MHGQTDSGQWQNKFEASLVDDSVACNCGVDLLAGMNESRSGKTGMCHTVYQAADVRQSLEWSLLQTTPIKHTF